MKGKITVYDPAKRYGFITAEDGQQLFFHERFLLLDEDEIPGVGLAVVFDPVDDPRGIQAHNIHRSDELQSEAVVRTITNSHHSHCFIVMPYGRDSDEIRWFRGWYQTVLQPAVSEAGYEPILASAEEKPNAINDEIRTHLAFDPMAVVDLGGRQPKDPPNPNVMYELGIRHALGLPVVMLGWTGQRLPFDIGNQRVIMEGRDLLDLETNRLRTVAFIEAARGGDFYRPMDAVGRSATLDVASMSLGRDSLLGTLTREVRELRRAVIPRPSGKRSTRPRIDSLSVRTRTSKADQKTLYAAYVDSGGPPNYWVAVLNDPLPIEVRDISGSWGISEWRDYISKKAAEKSETAAQKAAKKAAKAAGNSSNDGQPAVMHANDEELDSTSTVGLDESQEDSDIEARTSGEINGEGAGPESEETSHKEG